jgi:undecaprenyl diphosphate synthase
MAKPGKGDTFAMPAVLAEIPRERWPRHVAIIMDGNGRWAQQRRQARIRGHQEGAKAVRRVVEEAARLGLEQLTLYAFSHENWRRPKDEIEKLMALYEKYLRNERKGLMKNNLRFRNIGRREGLPAGVLREVAASEEMSAKNTGMVLCLAVNYGSRQEIADAARRVAEEAAAGQLDLAKIDEDVLAARLYTAGMIDPDLLVRTAGEQRVSNFLLWQISYAEIYVTEVLWPDFGEHDLHLAMADFASRERRFGGLTETPKRG